MTIISNITLRDNTGLLPMRLTCGCSCLGLYQHSGSDDLKTPFSWIVSSRHVLPRLASRWLSHVSILQPTKPFVDANCLLAKQDLSQ